MTIRPKTQRRVLILLVVAAVLVGGGIGLWHYRLGIAHARIEQFRSDGMAAYKAGDYKTAIEDLSRYVRVEQDDADAMLALGIARSKVPTLDNSHIPAAIGVLRKYCSLRPNDLETQHLLLELQEPYPVYRAPAEDLAHQILNLHPKDLVALKAMAKIETRARNYADALETAKQYCDLNPSDLEMQQTVLDLMQLTGQPSSALQQRANALAAQYPNDPRFVAVQGLAFGISQGIDQGSDQRAADLDSARKLFLDASKKDPPDVQFINLVVYALDHLHQFAAAQDLLNRGSAKFNDPDLTRSLMTRLWQSGHYDQVVAKLNDLNPATDDVELVALKALAFYELDRKSDANQLAKNLSARQDDPHAFAWSQALQARLSEATSDANTRTPLYLKALEHEPNNAIIHFLLGESYGQIGELELALQSYRQSSQLAASWVKPYIRVAKTLITLGRGTSREAQAAAEAAYVSGPDDPDASIVRIMVRFAFFEATRDSSLSQSLIKDTQDFQTRYPDNKTLLPIYVALMAQTDNRDKALDILRGVQGDPAKYSSDTLVDLARVSRVAKLGMERSLYTLAEKQYGLTPQVALAEAISLLEDGKASAGYQLLKDAKAKSKTDAVIWDRDMCLYLEGAHDPHAVDAWRKLGDDYPNDLECQTAILSNSESVWSDPALIDRTINRLQALTGDQSMTWRIARARLSLMGKDSDISAVIPLLTDVIKHDPDEAQPHMLLATAYEKLKRNDDAVTEWQRAAQLSPGSPQITFGLLRALSNNGKYDEARAAFDRLAGLPGVSDDLALQAAAIVASMGDMDRAEKMLVAHPHPVNQREHDAMLAKVYIVQGRTNDAATLYFKLADLPNLDLTTIREGAAFFGSQHDMGAAKKFLDRLDTMNLAPGHRELTLADFQEHFGDVTTAATLYAQAVSAAGDDAEPAIAQIGFFLRQQRWNDARDTVALDIKKWPNDDRFVTFKSAIDLIATNPDLAKQTVLISAISADPQNPAAPQTLDIVAQEPKAGAAQTLSDLQALFAKNPDFLPLYELIIRELIVLHRNNDAASMAAQAMAHFPQSAEAAQLAAQVDEDLGRWNEALAAARAWQQRNKARVPQADALIAAAELNLNMAHEAVSVLSPYIPTAQANPDQFQSVLVVYANALIHDNRESDAAQLLLPLAQKSPQWRRNWLALAAPAHPDAASSIAWIDQIRPLMDSKLLEDQWNLAEAYMACATRHNDPDAYKLAADTLKPFADSPTITVDALRTLADASYSAGDLATAEHADRKILAMDSSQAAVKNNLADLLRQKDDPAALTEAEQLAKQAVAVNPTDPNTSYYYDTLARVLFKEGRTDDAIDAFQHGDTLAPQNLNILIGLASVYARTNRMDMATRYLNRIDALVTATTPLSPALKAELDGARQMVSKGSDNRAAAGTDLQPAH